MQASRHASTPPVLVKRSVAPVSERPRILLLKLDHFGDMIMTLPAIEQLRRLFPRAWIRLICGPWNVASAAASGLVDDIRVYSYFPENAQGWSGVPVEPHERFLAAAQGYFDIAIDLRVDPDTRHLLAEVDAGLRCGIGGRGTFPFLDVVLPREVRGNAYLTEYEGLLGPDRFRSQFPRRHEFYHESDFSVTDRYLADGPDIALPRGAYRATFGLRLAGMLPPFGASILIEVTRDGTELVARKTLKRRRQIGLQETPMIEFINEHAGARFEFRVHTGGRARLCRLRFIGVYLRAVDAQGRPREHARFQPAELHVAEQLSLLVALLAERVRPQQALPHLAPAAPEAETARALLDLPPSDLRIVVVPFSNSELRTWPAVHFRVLVARLAALSGAQVLLIGSPSQHAQIERIAAGLQPAERIHNLAGETRWQDMPALLRTSDLVICNNSGVAHLAASLGVRVLALYSGSHQPAEWGPRGPHVTTLMLDVPCSPCGFDRLEDCPHQHRCMRDLTPEMVAAHAESLLAEARAAERTVASAGE